MERRTFLTAAAATLAASRLGAAEQRLPIKKALYESMLPSKLSYADRFKMARDVGFEQVECGTQTDQNKAAEIKKAAEAAGVRIHSVMNQAHWEFPLSSPDAAVVAKSIQGLETSIRNAHFWGADTVLLVPAVVTPQVGYHDAWVRSQQNIRKVLPLAEKLKVVIALEEVWNKFLLSPLEFARYVDEFKSPWIKAYFDIGNIVFYGYPQDWIRTLGKRIVKLHLKDFRFAHEKTEWKNLRDGAVDWHAVYAALKEIGYNGTATCELEGGDEAYLKDVSHRVDLILTNA
ncbi:MAG TPA: sugar phosphate isomerase/epimerase family protein [Bryobacteraceae bacterium]|nr:sugar phosphate isomerase/epimerase family protein [Bryobacteraceae bacterium]